MVAIGVLLFALGGAPSVLALSGPGMLAVLLIAAGHIASRL